MSLGSGASNLGYGGSPLNSNINNSLVNSNASTYVGGFTSNEMPPYGLRGIANGAEAVAASKLAPQSGGRKRKKMSRKYSRSRPVMGIRRTMRTQRKMRRLTRRVRRMRRSGRRRGNRRSMRGGNPYSQYHGGLAQSANYSLGGVNLPASESALANPPIIGGRYDNCPNAYNHYTGARG